MPGDLVAGLEIRTAEAADETTPHQAYRGWVVVQERFLSSYWSGKNSDHVQRIVYADTSSTSTDGQWKGDVYYRFDGTEPECDQRSELAGMGEGSAFGQVVPNENTDSYDHGLPFPTEMLAFNMHAFFGGEMGMHGVMYDCNNKKDETTGAETPIGTNYAGIEFPAEQYSEPPMVVARSYTFDDSNNLKRYEVTVCMSRSTVDMDGDLLPDDVDLAPLVPAASATDLGVPGGPPTEAIPPQFGGPPGVKGVPGCPARPTVSTVLVALGDSFSSGEGAYGYDSSTDVRGINHCHRSGQAYAPVAFQELRELPDPLDRIEFYACSGAVVANITNDRARRVAFCGSGCELKESDRVEAPQLAQLTMFLEYHKDAQVDVVTLGVGGNDAAFAKVIEECIKGSNCVAKLDPDVPGGERPGTSPTDTAALVRGLVEEIHNLVKDAIVVVVGYPVFIDKRYEDCPTGIGSDEAEWMRGQILTMNRLLAEIAKEPRTGGDIRYLSLDTVYGDHVHCNGGESDNWMNGLILDAPGGGDNRCIGAELKFGIIRCNESFHPKAEGQTATGRQLALCIQDASKCGSANPETVRKSSELSSDSQAWIIDDAPCAVFLPTCALQLGAPFKISVPGFNPGTEVQVDAWSDAVRLGAGIADSNGTATMTLTIPMDIPPGPHELKATGPGTNAIVRVGSLSIIVEAGSPEPTTTTVAPTTTTTVAPTTTTVAPTTTTVAPTTTTTLRPVSPFCALLRRLTRLPGWGALFRFLLPLLGCSV